MLILTPVFTVLRTHVRRAPAEGPPAPWATRARGPGRRAPPKLAGARPAGVGLALGWGRSGYDRYPGYGGTCQCISILFRYRPRRPQAEICVDETVFVQWIVRSLLNTRGAGSDLSETTFGIFRRRMRWRSTSRSRYGVPDKPVALSQIRNGTSALII